MKRFLLLFPLLVIIITVLALHVLKNKKAESIPVYKPVPTVSNQKVSENTQISSPLAISTMQKKSYPGSDIKEEQILVSGSNYHRYLVSYLSDRLKIYGLLTVPDGQKPSGGWPVILLNHGYIPPVEYSTENSYSSFVDAFASSGFMVFKPDYRGHGQSEGVATQIYVSPDYVTDSMNALESLKKYNVANPNKIGVIGHSMGGNITLRELLISKDIKAAVIASGVVGSYSDVLTWWNNREATGVLTTENDLQTLLLVKQFKQVHGTPQTNANFYNEIDPTNYISEISAPIQILVGSADEVVPPSFSQSLRDKLQNNRKIVDFHEYPGADHNLSPDTSIALAKARAIFNQYLK